MGNGNVFERLWKLQANANKLVLSGSRNPEQLCELYQKFIEVNRITFTVSGLGLMSDEWEKRIMDKSFRLGDWAKDILSKPYYNEEHRLEQGREYTLTLIRGKEINKDSERMTANLKALAIAELGEQAISGLKGEFAFLIREKFTDEELEEMGLWYIVVLHEPIFDSDGNPRVLNSNRNADASWLNAFCDSPRNQWIGDGAFAFLAK